MILAVITGGLHEYTATLEQRLEWKMTGTPPPPSLPFTIHQSSHFILSVKCFLLRYWLAEKIGLCARMK